MERLLSVYARHSKSSSVLLTAVEQQEEVGEDAAKLHGASRHQLAKEEPASSVASPDRTDSAACDRDTVGRSQSLTQFSPPSYPWVLPPATKPHRPKEHLPPFVRHCSNEPPPSTTPQHPAEVLHSSSVQLGSLEKLTRNLSSWIPPAHKAPERADPLHSTGKQNSRRPSSGGRLRAHQRSLSLQSLASTSSTLSHTSDTQSSESCLAALPQHQLLMIAHSLQVSAPRGGGVEDFGPPSRPSPQLTLVLMHSKVSYSNACVECWTY